MPSAAQHIQIGKADLPPPPLIGYTGPPPTVCIRQGQDQETQQIETASDPTFTPSGAVHQPAERA